MKILFFAPHAAVWEHSFPEALVASALQKKGHSVTYVSCGETFRSYCICMAARGVRFEKKTPEMQAAVCRMCTRNKDLIRKRLDLPGKDLSDVLTDQDRLEIRKEVAEVTRENFLSLTRSGIPVGRMALHEVILHHKKKNLDFDDSQWAYYLSALENCLLSLRGAERIMDAERPDALVLYSSSYSVNHIWKSLAEHRGIAPYLVQGSANFAEIHSHLVLLLDQSDCGSPYYSESVRRWETFKDVPATAESVDSVARHFEILFRKGSGFSYSPALKGISVREYFSVPKDAKVLTATLSSFDEAFASEIVGYAQFPEARIFLTQHEWVEKLIRFMKDRQDLFLIIRVHPREFSGMKTGAGISENARQLQEMLKDLPPNVRVNWPTDELSMYDVAEESDVILNGFSTVGAEMTLLGVPVVAYMSVDWFPVNLNYYAEDEADYFKKIDQALKDGWQPELIRKGFRWFSLLFYWNTLDFSENFRSMARASGNPWKRLGEDPIWFVDTVRDRVARQFDPQALPMSTQKHLARHAQISTKVVEEVDAVFSRGLRSLLDVREKAALAGSVEQENVLLRQGIGRLAKVMTQAGRSDGPLVRRLLQFAEGKEQLGGRMASAAQSGNSETRFMANETV